MKDTPASPADWRQIAGLVALWFAVFIDSTGFTLAIPVLQNALLDPIHPTLLPDASLEMRNVMLGVLVAAYSFTMLFMSPLLGQLSDRLGRKRVLVFCLAGLFLGNLLIAWSLVVGWAWLTLLGRLAAGATAGCQPVAQAAMVDWGPPEGKALRLSICLLASSLGFSFGPVLAGLLAGDPALGNWANALPVFFLSGLTLLGWLALAVFYHSPAVKADAAPSKLSMSDFLRSFQEVYRVRAVRFHMLCMLLMQVACSAYYSFAGVYLKLALHYSEPRSDTFQALFGVGNVIAFAIVLPILVKLTALRPLVAGSLAATGLSIGATVLLTQPPGEYSVALAYGITSAVAFGAFVTLISNDVAADRQGWILGVVGSTVSLGGVVAALASGALSALTPALPILLATVLLVLSAAGIALRSPAPEPVTVPATESV